VGRALECYRVAAFLAAAAGDGVVVAGEFVRVSARAGEVALRIGLARGGGDRGMGMDVDGHSLNLGGEGNGLDEETKKMGKEVVLECRGMGGTLEALGQVIEACLSDEILKSKYVPPFLSPSHLTNCPTHPLLTICTDTT